MTDSDRQQLIVAAARELIVDVAPGELPLVAPISAAYFADPDAALRAGQRAADEPLGFGVPVGSELWTPVVLAVLTQVVAFLIQEVKRSVQAEAPGLIDDVVRQLFKKLRPATTVTAEAPAPTLSTEQLTRVREIALEKGRQLGLTDTRAELLADALVGGLAVSP